jgi:hypothetical protein
MCITETLCQDVEWIQLAQVMKEWQGVLYVDIMLNDIIINATTFKSPN